MPSRRTRRALLGAVLCLFVLGVAAPAYAVDTFQEDSTVQGYDTFQECVDQAINHDGEPPVCTEVDGTWSASWPGEGGGGAGGILALVILGVLVTVGVTAWKVSTARRIAAESGMDPALATQMTLLSEDGLGATYLAANLRPAVTPPVPAGPASAAERLTELQELLKAGLVTQAEYDERRTAIIDSV